MYNNDDLSFFIELPEFKDIELPRNFSLSSKNSQIRSSRNFQEKIMMGVENLEIPEKS